MKLSRRLKRTLIDWYKTLRLYRFYHFCITNTPPKTKQIIIMLDGRRIHGGLSDRFWGIVSTYKYCKDRGIDFRINFTSPYKLEEFLLPNKVNWKINPNDIEYNFPSSRPRYISIFTHDRKEMAHYYEHVLDQKCHQLHLYTNTQSIDDKEYANLFNELFVLSPRLQESIKEIKDIIGLDYISITFRFQQLLGDFNEGNFPIIKDKNERKELINKCLSLIKELKQRKESNILVTSDSISFLHEASKIENVFIIPGKLVHVDFNADHESYKVHEKSFLDLFLISQASEVYLANFKPLFHSGFPKTAALIGGRKYIELDLK